MSYFKIQIFTLLIILCNSSLVAQHSLDSIQQLNEISVIANRHREVIPVQRLAGKELENLSSFSVADAIRYFSGVQIKDYGGIGGLKTVNIRSMGTHHMGVFYDGIQLGNAQNGQIDLGKFSLDNIEEISLYNGQKSEIFQPAKDFGSAGSIYLRTRHPQFKDEKKTNLTTYFRTGSFDLINPSALWEQKISENVSASLNAEYIYSSGKYKFRYKRILSDGNVAWDTTAIRQNGDIHSYRLEGGFHGLVNNGRWNAKAYYYDSEKGIPGAIVNNRWTHSQRQWDKNFFVQGSYQKRMTKKYDLQFNIKYANDRMRYLNPDTTLMFVDNKFRQQEIYFSTAHKYSILPSWDINIATDYQWNILDASLQDFVNPKRNTLLLAAATAFEWNRLKAQASLLSTFVFEHVTRIQHSQTKDMLPGAQAGTPSDKQEFTPALFVSYQPFGKHDLTARAFYKRIFRMPTFNDLYYTNIGNIALRPEYTTQYNIGVMYHKKTKLKVLSDFNFKADFYYNEVTDKIIAVPKGDGQYRWMMLNIGYVEIRGVDISAQANWVLPKEIHLATNLVYTYQKAQDFSDPNDNDPKSGTYGGQIAYIPWHSGSFIANLSWKKWNFNYSFIYVGERYHHSSNIPQNHERPWYTNDLTLGRDISYKNLKFKVSAEVNNLLNQYHDVVSNYPMPGRNYKLILKLEL